MQTNNILLTTEHRKHIMLKVRLFTILDSNTSEKRWDGGQHKSGKLSDTKQKQLEKAMIRAPMRGRVSQRLRRAKPQI